MIFIKYILIFFIFTISIIIGNSYSKKYSVREKELKEILNILNVIKAKIKFTGQGIHEIFEQICIINQDNIGNMFKMANEFMEEECASASFEKAADLLEKNSSLNKEDIEAIKSFSKMLGNTDIEGQVSQIELVENLIKKQIEQATEEKRKNSKLYKTLGVTVGLTITIILI